MFTTIIDPEADQGDIMRRMLQVVAIACPFFLVPVLATSQTVTVKFRANLAVYATMGYFRPGVDSVFVCGAFNGWSATNDTLAREFDTVYSKTISFPASSNQLYKFRIGSPGTYANGWEGFVGPEGIYGNRQISLGETDTILAMSWFENCEPGIHRAIESEINNTIFDANQILIGDSLNASISPTGEVDYFKFLATGGDTVEIFAHDRDESGLNGMIRLFYVVWRRTWQ